MCSNDDCEFCRATGEIDGDVCPWCNGYRVLTEDVHDPPDSGAVILWGMAALLFWVVVVFTVTEVVAR